MTESKLDPEAYAAARLAARAASYELQRKFESDGDPFGWFEALYRRAEGERAAVPWADAAPRFRLEAWLAECGLPADRAIDVGCGLGENAQILAKAGWQLTAFDISATAIAWARELMAARFPEINVQFQHADLFDFPPEWRGAFDLVHETYNLQALPRDRAGEAAHQIAALAAPGGTVLIMTRAREDGETPEGPPWPLSRRELKAFRDAGLEEIRFEEFYDRRDDPIRHFLVEYRRS
jgi:SAM-dependent methyltransferase